MSNYEGKLGEWLKYVQQQMDSSDQPEAQDKPEKKAEVSPLPPVEEPGEPTERITMRERLGRVMPEDTMNIDVDEVIANSSLIDEHRTPLDRLPPIFSESDVPDVEDFLSFLKDPAPETRMPPAPEPRREAPPVPETPASSSLDRLSEGTGEPKPIERKRPEPTIPESPRDVRPVTRVRKPRAIAKAEILPPGPSVPSDIRSAWDKMPKHIQILFGQPPKEVAQHSYKEFKDTREDLIEKLLDPTMSLEEAARILNVCPTTVRRYTNRGVLRHFRTAGNQRRFRLSDVLAFLESASRPAISAQAEPEETEN
jgi:excisionase family DNA binding protein